MPGEVTDGIWIAMSEPSDLRCSDGFVAGDGKIKYRVSFDIELDREIRDALWRLAVGRQRSPKTVVRDAVKHGLSTCLTWRRYIPDAGIIDE
jgi:hypothetical protein